MAGVKAWKILKAQKEIMYKVSEVIRIIGLFAKDEQIDLLGLLFSHLVTSDDAVRVLEKAQKYRNDRGEP